MHIKASTLALTDLGMFSIESRVKVAIVKAMNGQIEYCFILIKYIRSAIPHMYVPIEYANLFYSELSLCISCCHSDIVKETEASYVNTRCVMTWGSNDAKSRVHIIIHDSAYTFYGTTGSQVCRCGSMCIFIGVILESPSVLSPSKQYVLLHSSALWVVHVYRILNFLHVRVRMHILQMFVLSWGKIQVYQVFIHAFLYQIKINGHGSLWAFRVMLVVKFVQKHLLVKDNAHLWLY